MKITKKKILTKAICLISIISPVAAFATLEPIEGVPNKPIEEVLDDMTAWLVGFGITLCVLMIIWGGLNYAASVGDDERIKKSKKTIHYAIWGIAIIGFSYAIIRVVNDILT